MIETNEYLNKKDKTIIWFMVGMSISIVFSVFIVDKQILSAEDDFITKVSSANGKLLSVGLVLLGFNLFKTKYKFKSKEEKVFLNKTVADIQDYIELKGLIYASRCLFGIAFCLDVFSITTFKFENHLVLVSFYLFLCVLILYVFNFLCLNIKSIERYKEFVFDNLYIKKFESYKNCNVDIETFCFILSYTCKNLMKLQQYLPLLNYTDIKSVSIQELKKYH